MVPGEIKVSDPQSSYVFAPFDALGSSTVTSHSSTPVPTVAHMETANGKPTRSTKIGGTWAGTSDFIDIDNLASQSTPVKQSPSLHQIQKNKQTGTIGDLYLFSV
ncbi:hypothetical protein COOONC_02665 [Cooperia oncophora]